MLLLAVHKREIPFFMIMVSEVRYEEKLGEAKKYKKVIGEGINPLLRSWKEYTWDRHGLSIQQIRGIVMKPKAKSSLEVYAY